MTLKQALQGIFQFEIADDTLEKALADSSLAVTDTYVSATHQQPIDLCAAGLCTILITTPNVSENGLSIQFDTGKLRELRSGLLAKYGLPGTEPEIKTDPVW